jgi:hypothetical protein
MVYLEEMSHKDQGRKFIASPIIHGHLLHIYKLLIHISWQYGLMKKNRNERDNVEIIAEMNKIDV